MTPTTEGTPTTDCHHTNVVTMTGANYGVDVGVYLWACADCRVRLYPACPVCVDVGHRSVAHVDLAAKVRADLIERVEGLPSIVGYGVTHGDRQEDRIVNWIDRAAVLAILRDDKEAGGGG